MIAIAAETRTDRSAPPASADAGASSTRRCIVTGETAPRGGLIRFVVGPSGEVVPDLAGKLPGRGLWLAADRSVLARADARAFARAARTAVEVPADLAARVEAGLVRRLVGYIGMARRAGGLVAGFEKTRDALKAGKARLLLAATDGAADGRAKLRALVPEQDEVAVLTAAELGAAIGRETTVHAVVTDEKLAREIAREAGRLAGVRGERPGVHANGLLDRVEQA